MERVAFPPTQEVQIIAEIGVNHNGEVALARELIDAVAGAGGNFAKFQVFDPARLVTSRASKVSYQNRNDGRSRSHRQMLADLALGESQLRSLAKHSEEAGLSFVATPYDVDSLQFLVDLGVPFIKIASADIVDMALHEAAASSGLPVVLSVGMATLGEIETALEVYGPPASRRVTLLHTVSNYPSSRASLNLRVMPTLRSAFGAEVGFSDHSDAPLTAVAAAVALGAVCVERHLTLDRSLPGPDHAASSDPEEFRDYVRVIRSVEEMLGSSLKLVQSEELDMRRLSRKSWHFSKDLPAGHRLGVEDLVFCRPGDGVAYRAVESLIGASLAQPVSREDPVQLSQFTDYT